MTFRTLLTFGLCAFRVSQAVRYQDNALQMSLLGGDLEVEDVHSSDHTTNGPVELASLIMTRTCVEEIAERFEAYIKQELPEFWPGLGECWTYDAKTALDKSLCDSLPVLLGELWAAEDEEKKHHFTYLKNKIEYFRGYIKNRKFSVSSAEHVCKSNMDKPKDSVIQSCMLGSIDEGQAGGKKIVGDDDEKTILKGLITRMRELEQHKVLLEKVLDFNMINRPDSAKQQISYKEEDINKLRSDIDTNGYLYANELKRCEETHSGEDAHHAANIIAHIKAEIEESVSDESGTCTEKDDFYCPEGSSAKHERSFDKQKFGVIFGALYPVYEVSSYPLAFLIGSLFGGPPAGLACVAAISIPGSGVVGTAVVASALSVDIVPVCRCYVNECEYDEELSACVMTQSTSSNPFGRLPFPGQRCVVKEFNGDKPTCEMTPCRPYDYKKPWSEAPIFGTLGVQPGSATHNCVSTTGRAGDSLLTAREIPKGDHQLVPNNAVNRAAFFRFLNVSL